VTYRPYVVKEEKLLLIAMESQDEKQIETAVMNIIEECIESPININELTTFDVEFMFVTLRAKSVGEGIQLSPKCSSCEEVNEIKVNLDDVTVANLNDQVDKLIKLTDDISLELKWSTMKDRHINLEDKTETETIINMITNSIGMIYSGEETFNCNDVPNGEVRDFVESLSNEQFNQIVDVMAKAPTLSYEINFDCKKCGESNSIEINGLADFFQ
ncbi:MAG: hypothetical protein P8N43_07010, partial [Alphaproteobacteria bacterium]|nr:hypothetical protein [Alphaproteobacteria bacterium]